MKKLEVKNLSYLYDTRSTDGVKDLNFHIDENEIISLIGPSGSGKSSTLKLIKGILKPQNGELNLAKSKIGYVAQSSRLDEELTVFKLLELETEYLNDKEKQENQIRSTLSTLQITNEIHSQIKTLSGGQRQRVLIASALIHNPQLLLLDEPFGHLDQVLRFDLIQDLFETFKDKKISVLWVTHDTNEALAFSDRIIVLNFGKIIQNDIPSKIYREPKNLFVANFIGLKNTFILSYNNKKEGYFLFNKELKVDTALRTEELVLFCQNGATKLDPKGSYKAKVLRSYFYGQHSWIYCKIGERNLWVLNETQENLSQSQEIRFTINLDLCHISESL